MESTQLEAAKRGESEYFTGKPCKNGHIAFRSTVSGACKECNVEYVRRHKSKLRELINAANEESSKEG